MNAAVPRHVDDFEYECRSVMDVCDLKDLYGDICNALVEDELMEKLNSLFRQ
jgi:hypothetical protein